MHQPSPWRVVSNLDMIACDCPQIVASVRAGEVAHPPPRRGSSSRLDDVLDLFAPAQNFHRQHRVAEALELQIVHRHSVDPAFNHAVDAAAHHDLAGLGFGAQARGEIGDTADRSIFEPVFEADLAERCIAECNTDAAAETVAAVAPSLGKKPDQVAPPLLTAIAVRDSRNCSWPWPLSCESWLTAATWFKSWA
jgi:hypothetical protein